MNNNNNECCCVCMRRRLLNCVMVFVHYCTSFLTDILGVRVYILDLDVPYSKSKVDESSIKGSPYGSDR